MSSHDGPVVVYGEPRQRWLAPFTRPGASFALCAVTLTALLAGAALVALGPYAAGAAVAAGLLAWGWKLLEAVRRVVRVRERTCVSVSGVMLAGWVRMNRVHPQTAYRWLGEGRLPVPARRLASGAIWVDAVPGSRIGWRGAVCPGVRS